MSRVRGFRSVLLLAVGFVLLGPTVGSATVVDRHTPTHLAADSSSAFSLSGTVSKVSVATNEVTILSKKKRYTVLTSSTTVVTVKSKHSSIRGLKVGTEITVTGKLLGPLRLALTIRA
jgi:Cu/Ag efflux protein CusF